MIGLDPNLLNNILMNYTVYYQEFMDIENSFGSWFTIIISIIICVIGIIFWLILSLLFIGVGMTPKHQRGIHDKLIIIGWFISVLFILIYPYAYCYYHQQQKILSIENKINPNKINKTKQDGSIFIWFYIKTMPKNAHEDYITVYQKHKETLNEIYNKIDLQFQKSIVEQYIEIWRAFSLTIEKPVSNKYDIKVKIQNNQELINAIADVMKPKLTTDEVEKFKRQLISCYEIKYQGSIKLTPNQNGELICFNNHIINTLKDK